MILMPPLRRHPRLFWPLLAINILLLLGGVFWLV